MADLGTVIITEEDNFCTIKKIIFDWTSVNGGGDAGKATKTTINSYSGEVIRLVTNPDGTDVPTDNYTVIINDEDGNDILMGAAVANRDQTNTEQILASSLGCVANDKLSLTISGAGNGKKGVVYLYIR